MSDLALTDIEAAMRFARGRGALLAADVANARTPGFVARDAAIVSGGDSGGATFGVVLEDVSARGAVGILEYAMGAQARNAVTYHELADQERAMLHEMRTVAEEARR
jgi:hypothetical protein